MESIIIILILGPLVFAAIIINEIINARKDRELLEKFRRQDSEIAPITDEIERLRAQQDAISERSKWRFQIWLGSSRKVSNGWMNCLSEPRPGRSKTVG